MPSTPDAFNERTTAGGILVSCRRTRTIHYVLWSWILLCGVVAPFFFRRWDPTSFAVELVVPASLVALWRVRNLHLVVNKSGVTVYGIFVTRHWKREDVTNFAVDGQHCLPVVMTRSGRSTRVWALQYPGPNWSGTMGQMAGLAQRLNRCLYQLAQESPSNSAPDEQLLGKPQLVMRGRPVRARA
jgi:hypothetical protein